MNIAHYLDHSTRIGPERPALYHGPALHSTYAELQQRVKALAGHFTRQGLAPGERVAIYMKNRPAYLDALIATWYAGLVVVPINAKLHWREVDYILEDSGSRLLISDRTPDTTLASPARLLLLESPDFAPEGQPLSAPLTRASYDAAWIFYTSGTTGQPKGATLSHGNLACMANCYLTNVDHVENDQVLAHFAPLSHGSGIYLIPYLMRGCASLVPASAGFDEAEFIELVNQHRGLAMFLAPTMIRRLVDHLDASQAELNIDHLQAIVYGGGPMYERDLRDALTTFGSRLVQIYGQGESPMTISVMSREAHAPYAEPGEVSADRQALVPVGRPHPQVEVAIQDSEGNPLPDGQEGEICVRGDSVMLGYWNNHEATSEALRGGWLRTGDIGRMAADGTLFLTDRVKDVIISGGTNIYPREVEEVLLQHPAVHEVSVIGAPHPEWGEEVVAFVSLHRPLDPAELDQHCLERMARFKRPRRYEVLEALPKNAYGKIVKTALRQRLARQQEESAP
ncbi:AMP-binding protein [Halomonas campisalis]|uniref:AMP-binding protein n=1 Tax=Billgrantia campisalis TaxID=74661 RepID=A0ABS9PCW0_9GAMM|nr:AMP-binding protein [Halomonas campisalis]MCG6659596.1 AMP-binding protein [Halomonas campisalis]MDR5864557.1 AMP-binding protein [Halomonas campisalis]